MGLELWRRRWASLARLEPKPGVSQRRARRSPDSIRGQDSGTTVTWALSATSPTSRRSRVRARAVLPTLVWEMRLITISRWDASGMTSHRRFGMDEKVDGDAGKEAPPGRFPIGTALSGIGEAFQFSVKGAGLQQDEAQGRIDLLVQVLEKGQVAFLFGSGGKGENGDHFTALSRQGEVTPVFLAEGEEGQPMGVHGGPEGILEPLRDLAFEGFVRSKGVGDQGDATGRPGGAGEQTGKIARRGFPVGQGPHLIGRSGAPQQGE